MRTSAAQAKCKLNEHFESLRQCVNDALCERLATLQQTVDNVAQESLVPLDRCEQDIQNRVEIAKQILDTGVYVRDVYDHCLLTFLGFDRTSVEEQTTVTSVT